MYLTAIAHSESVERRARLIDLRLAMAPTRAASTTRCASSTPRAHCRRMKDERRG
jgi:hypothetical protein